MEGTDSDGSSPVDQRVIDHYSRIDEAARLWSPGKGELIRLRTWDIFDRYLPGSGRLLDVGGGPGIHASHLAGLGYDVTLIDPVESHVTSARQRAASGPPFRAELGDASQLPTNDASIDVVLLMGPLYHLREPQDRARALAEAQRVLRPGGVLIAETISRYAWLLDATNQQRLATPGIFDDFVTNLSTGHNLADERFSDGDFWAYMHHPDELATEVGTDGFADVSLVAVEGFAWLLGDLADRLQHPDQLLSAIRLTETEPSMLSSSAHVLAVAHRR